MRAILAILLVVATIMLAFAGKLEPREVATLAGISIAFYFATRPRSA